MKNSVHDNGGFIGRVADYAATDYYQALTTTTANVSSSAGYDLNNATYDNVSSSAITQDAALQDLSFSSDGTKMYICGRNNDTIYQYTLSTAWNVSTALYANKSYYIGGQEDSLSDIFFKADGSKFYIIGYVSDQVHQYSLSTAWDISTASYDNLEFSVSSQEDNPRGLTFKPDGTKMFVIGQTADAIQEYALSTAWNVSSASHTSTFSTSSQLTNNQALFFAPDGYKVWATGADDVIYQYILTTAWDISTASYDSVSFSVLSQSTQTLGIEFSTDGTKLYALDNTLNIVYQYSTGTAYEVTNAPYTNVSIATGNTSTVGVSFSVDGTKVYFQSASDTKYATLSTPSDLNSAGSFTSVTGGSSRQSIIFRPDGLKVNWTRYDGYVEFSNLTVAWELNSKGPTYLFDSGVTNLRSMQFNNDGTKVYLLKSGTIYSYPTTNYALSASIVNSTNSTSQSLTGTDQQGFRFNPDGTKLFVIHGNGYSSSILEYSLSTAYDITTIGSATTHTTTASQVSDATDIAFSHDGRKFFIVGVNNSNVYEFGSNVVVNSIGDSNKKNTGVWSMDADYLNSATIGTPAIFSTAKVHVDADDINSYSGTGTTWSDLSGNGYDLTMSSSGVYSSTGVKHMAFQNSSDKALYSGSGDIPISQTNGITYVVATRPKSGTPSWKTMTRSNSVSEHHVIIQNGVNIGMWDSGFKDSGIDQSNLPSHTNNDWILMYFRWANGQGYKFSYNDTPSTIRGTLATNASAQYNSGGFRALGNYQGGGQPWGDIALFAAWETELTDAQLTAIYNAYQNRFSLP